MPSRTASRSDPLAVSHNVMGQRLGRKGQETRSRIIAAFERLLTGPADCQITLSGVANEASVGPSTPYLYFPDFGALVLAGLRRLTARARIGFVETLREHWPDEVLDEKCLEFVRKYFQFWSENARILHLRNSLADANDLRFVNSRHKAFLPIIEMIARQMDAEPGGEDFALHLGMVLLTGVERICTVLTNPVTHVAMRDDYGQNRDQVEKLIVAEALLIEVAIRHQRQAEAARLIERRANAGLARAR